MNRSGRRSYPSARIVALAALAIAGACAERGADEAASLPDGAWLVGEGDALARVLAGLERLHGSELAQRASSLRERLGACEDVRGHADGTAASALLTSLRCARPEADAALPGRLRALRGDASLLLLTAASNGLRLVVRGDVDGRGGVDAAVDLIAVDEREALPGALRFLVPAARTAGPARLAADGTLVHARLRPAGGLDLASLLARGGQADRMFRLTSSLFAGAALDGTWELAIYEPAAASTGAERADAAPPDAAVPPVALGLGLSVPTAARAGVEAFVSELEATWPIRRRPATFAVDADGGSVEGACFFDLRILPAFAPCWASRDDLLVIGWNPRSIQRALASAGDARRGPRDGAVLDLSRWPRADAAIARARAVQAGARWVDEHGHEVVTGAATRAPQARFDYAWRRAFVEARRGGDAAPIDALVSLRLRLLAAEHS